jgi:hypothetical protein
MYKINSILHDIKYNRALITDTPFSDQYEVLTEFGVRAYFSIHTDLNLYTDIFCE